MQAEFAQFNPQLSGSIGFGVVLVAAERED
jgi:hypothetical protein